MSVITGIPAESLQVRSRTKKTNKKLTIEEDLHGQGRRGCDQLWAHHPCFFESDGHRKQRALPIQVDYGRSVGSPCRNGGCLEILRIQLDIQEHVILRAVLHV